MLAQLGTPYFFVTRLTYSNWKFFVFCSVLLRIGAAYFYLSGFGTNFIASIFFISSDNRLRRFCFLFTYEGVINKII